MLTPMRVLMADHQRLSRRSLASLLRDNKRIRIVAEASGAAEALARVAEVRPHLVLIQSSMPDFSYEVLSELSQWTKVLVLAENESPEQLVECLKAGAHGYVGKDIEPESLFHCISCVIHGGMVATPGAVLRAIESHASERPSLRVPRLRVSSGPTLTAREIQTLGLVAQGATNREIAEALSISESTVKTHLRNILDKLRLNNKAQAAAWATQIGLIRLEEETGWQERIECATAESVAVAEGA